MRVRGVIFFSRESERRYCFEVKVVIDARGETYTKLIDLYTEPIKHDLRLISIGDQKCINVRARGWTSLPNRESAYWMQIQEDCDEQLFVEMAEEYGWEKVA